MKKRQANAFKVDGEKTAAFIIAHARWQKSRGRNPSEGYGFEKNPHKALEVAYAELATYRTSAGQHLARAAEEMVVLAKFTKRPCSTDFNGIELTATHESNADAIVDFYHHASERRAEEYRNSPEGKAAAAKALARKRALQLQMNSAMAELPKLDLSNLGEVIAWFGKIQPPSDRIDIKTPVEKIIPLFEEAGYVANANCGGEYDENDMENAGRYLVGQALAGLKEMGAIHQIYPHFEQQWRERFAA